MYYRKANTKNFSQVKRSISNIHYIVVHYTAGKKDTARNNVDAFATHVTKTSAHFFVDEKEVAQSVPVEYAAWHCGGAKYNNGAPAPFHGKCYNSNSIGVEMCSRWKDGAFYIPYQTKILAARHVAELMRKYGVSLDHVVRHYDVTGKHCPEPFVRMPSEWAIFKTLVAQEYAKGGNNNGEMQKEEKPKRVQEMTYYEKLEEIPAGEMRDTVKDLYDLGIVKGTGKGLHLSEDMVRMLVWLRRASVI